MPTRNSASSLILLSFFLLALCMLPGVNNGLASNTNSASIAALENLSPALAQKGPNVVAGAPLKGCDVKLGKPPGGSPAARTTTDDKGKFNLGVVPKGSYFLTLDFDPRSSTGNPAGPTRGSAAGADAKVFLITIDGAVGGQTQRGWDVKTKKPFDPASQTTAKTTDQDKIVIESDGQTPLTGIVQTAVVKSKSNITNN